MSFNPDQNKQAQGVIFRSKSTNIQLCKSLSKHSTKTFKSQAWASGAVLRNFAKFTRKHLWQSLFFIYILLGFIFVNRKLWDFLSGLIPVNCSWEN